MPTALGKVDGKDEISASLESFNPLSEEHSYTATYLRKYGIGNINSMKMNLIENKLREGFYKDLPSPYTLSRSITELFLNHYYDETDLNNRTAVTDALLKCFFASIGDPYAYYRNKEEFAAYIDMLSGNNSFVGIGISIDVNTLEIITVYRDSPAERAGILAGDILYAVDGKTTDDYTADEITDLIKGEIGTEVKITLIRNGEKIDVTAIRDKLTEKTVFYELTENGSIGYITISQFTGTTHAQFCEAVDYMTENNVKALCIDVRGNPGGDLNSVVNIIDYLIPDAKDRMIACYTENSGTHTFYTQDGHGVDVPIAVLCNKGTASAGELFTAAMRDFDDIGVIDAVTVGTVTYGKGVVQTSEYLTDKTGITYTIGYYNPPCNINFDGKGIEPDLPIELVDRNDDIQRDAAYEELYKMIGIQDDIDMISLLAA